MSGERRIGGAKAQSTTIAVIILFGMVALGSVGVFLVAGQTVSEVERQAEEERIEQAFVQLSHNMATASSDKGVSKSMNFEAGESGAVTKTDAGTIHIEADGVNETLRMGSIEYESDDGTIIAYQAGGVWRETGNETQMVSAPPIQYNFRTETVTVPIDTVSGEQDLSSGTVAITHNSTDPVRNVSVVENDSITMTITSDYYLGWKEYFETQAGDAVVRDVDHENRTVKVEFGYMEVENAFESGATYSDSFETQGNPTVNAPLEEGYMPPLDDVIAEMIDDAQTGEMDVDRNLGRVTGTEQLSNGTYYADEIDGGHLEFNLTEGNATLIVDGDITADGDTITVSDRENGNSLKIYTSGDYDARNGGRACVDPCADDVSAKYIQLYGTSDTQVDLGPGGNARFEGLLYVASTKENWPRRNGCDSQVCLHSNPSFYGSIVASSVEIQGGAAEFVYDTDLEDTDIELYPEEYSLPPKLTFLNIVVNELDVKNT